MGVTRRVPGLALSVAFALLAPAHAEPYRPVDDTEVVERVSEAPADPGSRRLTALRQRLAEAPNDLYLALALADTYVERGRAASDPRYYAYAQAALAPWWTIAEPPVPALVLRAIIKQHDHQFAQALDDLELALRADPFNLRARWTHAVVLHVRGDYGAARDSCQQLLQFADPLIAASCLSAVDSLTGAAERAYTLLNNVLEKSPSSAAARAWSLTTLAEIAARMGNQKAAEAHFRAALAITPNDHYLLAAYADFLLDSARPAAARELLRQQPVTDALLLRLALAEHALSAPEAARHIAILRDRFASARVRGSSLHGREEARFALAFQQDPAAALTLARANWEIQREPADARVLLEAALAAGDPAAARPVLDFIATHRTQDVTLHRLVTALEAASQ